MTRHASSDSSLPRYFVRPVEEIPPDDLVPEQTEKTDIFGRTCAQLEDEIDRQKIVIDIAASYSGGEGNARRTDELRRNLAIDCEYLDELEKRPDHWPRDGREALGYSMEKRETSKRRNMRSGDQFEEGLEID